ncbi:carboxymuconolactone decarboxylase family protein [Bdellovibrio sp. HCB337]|uniref:carboxymuconolactone decarboxylase family protein n=1 Tax=Bdellovibrio sp. HCB337 TaxID=3394358 RepID=UPI0039A76FED
MQRLHYYPQIPEAMAKMTELEGLIKKSSIDRHLIHLVKLRASQINRCAFCVDMHSKEAKIDDERELRLYHVAVWEESPLFSPKEKAALKWTEALTKLSSESIDDALYSEVKEHFSDKELSELTLAIGMINLWNRFAVPFRSVPGSADKAWGLDKAGL